jgi:hypothetical protein
MRQERFTEYWEEFDSKLERALCWQGRDYSSLLPESLRGRDRDVCPAFVFALSDNWRLKRRDIVELALALEYSYLSFRAHRLERNANLREKNRQYGILFGDFFAAQALMALSGDLLFPHYAIFAELIRTMNEGLLLRRRLNRKNMSAEDWRAVLRREKSALTLPVRVMADWVSLARREALFLERLAEEFGVLWGAREEGNLIVWRGSLDAAKAMIAEAPLPRDELGFFLSDLAGEIGERPEPRCNSSV